VENHLPVVVRHTALSVEQDTIERIGLSHILQWSGASSMARPVEDAARSFVERVLAMVLQIKKEDPKSCDTVQVLPFDDLYGLALRMFTARKEFRELGKPTDVVLSYHYTDEANMASIRTNGLMNREERAAHDLKPVEEHGHFLGTGIYTADTPCFAADSGYGGVGLLVACLLGANAACGASKIGSADSLSYGRVGETIIVSSCDVVQSL
jgi:hypothetical protein